MEKQTSDGGNKEQMPPVAFFSALLQDFGRLIALEVQLARTELREQFDRLTRSISAMAIGGLLAYVGLLALVIVILLGCAVFLSPWLAAFLLGLLLLSLGALLVQTGRNQLGTTMQMVTRPKTGTVEQQESPAQGQGREQKHKRGVKDTNNSNTRGKGTLWQILKETVQEWIADDASQLAAALSYYTAVSIAPLLVLVVVIVGLFLGAQTAESQLLAQLQGAMGTEGSQFLQTVLENADQPTLASAAGILSFLTLLWGATNVFSQLQNSLNAIWDVEKKTGGGIWQTIRARFLSFTLVLGIAFLLLVSLVISAGLSTLTEWGHGFLPGADWLWQVVNLLVSFAIVTVLFAAIYKVLPDIKIAWRDVWLGAAVTALLFTLGKFILGWYLANAGSAYGAVGSLVVFLLWVYYSAQILFLGAEFTQVYIRHHGAARESVASLN